MNTTQTAPADTAIWLHDVEVSRTIRSQIALSTFMTLGASDLARSGADLTFKARILPSPSHSRGRVMRVRVHLNEKDLYDVTVGYSKPRTYEWVQHAEAADLDAEQMNRYLFSLDCVI